jgi:hypothetical protein
MSEPYDSVRQKVSAIFTEIAGQRANMLEGSRLPANITSTITAALVESHCVTTDILKADEIAFHLTDWNSDAAFLVALHLFPERFTPEEISAGIDLFLVHVPAHVIAAARLTGNSTDDVFANETEG